MQHTIVVGDESETKNLIRAMIHQFDGTTLSFRGALSGLLPDARKVEDWKETKTRLLTRGNSTDILILAEEQSFWNRQDFQLLMEMVKRGRAAGVYLLARFSERRLIPDEVLANAKIVEPTTAA